jgi:NAD(P)-dependent dehydrogenase (short-subunit alcohol dehydrogenase family)
MRIEGVVALVTGADRGVGAALVHALLARGATRVYGATPDAGSAEQLRFVPVQLDAARPGQLKALARELGDVSLLVNHVALLEPAPFRTADAHDEFAVVNVESVSSTSAPWNPRDPDVGSRTSDWALSDGLRSRLEAQRTQLLYVRAALVG